MHRWHKGAHNLLSRHRQALLKFPLAKLAGPAPASDIRDWEAIRAWAATLPTML